MCYVCQDCKVSQRPRMPRVTVVVETRKRVYDLGFDEDGKPKQSLGEEIVKEKYVCPPCANVPIPDHILRKVNNEIPRVEVPEAIIVTLQ